MKYSIRPEEHELREARQVTEKVLEASQYVVEKEDEFQVSLGWVEEEAAGEHHAFGKARTSKYGRIYFNANFDGWKDDLEKVVASIYGQAWFMENSEVNFKWQKALASMIGLKVIEKVADQERNPGDKEDYRAEWAEKKTELDEELTLKNQENLSWQLKKLVADKLLEEHYLKEFTKLKRTDVLDAGDALFS